MTRLLLIALLATGCASDPSSPGDGGEQWYGERGCNAPQGSLERASAERLYDCEAYRDDG